MRAVEPLSAASLSELKSAYGRLIDSENAGNVAAIQQQIAMLQRKLAVSEGQIVSLNAKRYVVSPKSSSEIAARLQEYTSEFEKQQSAVRMIDPWTIGLSGGAVPPMQQGDGLAWFGMVSAQYSFGGLTRSHFENQYQDARRAELAHARYELVDQIHRLQAGVIAGIGASSMEIESLDKHIAELNDTKSQLKSHPDAPNVANALSLIELQIMDAMSDREYLVELRKQLTEWK